MNLGPYRKGIAALIGVLGQLLVGFGLDPGTTETIMQIVIAVATLAGVYMAPNDPLIVGSVTDNHNESRSPLIVGVFAVLLVLLMAGCQNSPTKPESDPEAMALGYATGEWLIRMADVERQDCEMRRETAQAKLGCVEQYESRLADIDEGVDAIRRYKRGWFGGIFSGVSEAEFNASNRRLAAMAAVFRGLSNMTDYEVIE